jgi:phosphotriesterase-related protein
VTTLNSVTGPVDSADLGFTLMHEHVCSTSQGIWQAWPELLGGRENFLNEVVETLSSAKQAGISSFVDVTTIDLGRDIRLIREAAERSEMTILACTGHWLDGSRSMQVRTVDEITEFFLKEIEVGIEGTDIKAAIIKVANDFTPQLSPFGENICRAAARAHRATGLPITTHAGAKLELGLRQAEIFEDEGVDPARVYIGHSDDTDSMNYLTGLLDRGYWVGLDRIVLGYRINPPFNVRAQIAADLVKRGYREKICISHDYPLGLTLHTTADEQVRQSHVPESIQFILKRYLPALKEHGVTDEDIDQIMVTNPRNYFEGNGPAAGRPGDTRTEAPAASRH